MLSGLILTTFLMGLAGVPHCAAMCGVACAAALPKGVPMLTSVGRASGYAALGAMAAASAGLVSQWGRQFSFLQPLWVMALVACIFIGLWMSASGKMPERFDRFGMGLYGRIRRRIGPAFANTDRSGLVSPRRRLFFQWIAGLVWAALPCGLLYSAVMVAALAPSPLGGAAVMLAFAVPSGFGVWSAPALLRWTKRLVPRPPAISAQAPWGATTDTTAVVWLQQSRTDLDVNAPNQVLNVSPDGAWVNPQWAIRASGLLMAGMAAWAAYHQVMSQWRAWCA